MDDIVKQAIAKWPDVPACHGWLALDARGHWRMRDERTQSLDLAGDKIAHVALMAFIARNYDQDDDGCWFFQNGPQRVYVNLESTPYIARTDPAQGLVLQTGAALAQIERVYLLENGEPVLQAGDVVAQLDDRDVAQLFEGLELDGQPADDDALLAWISGGAGSLVLRWRGAAVPVERIARATLAQRFGFVPAPAAPAA